MKYEAMSVNKSMIVGTLLGAAAVTATGTLASFGLFERGPDYAEVLNVMAVTEVVSTPAEKCRDEVVTYKQPTKDSHQIAGTVIGAVLGGVLGKQIGGGNGKKLATVAGAAAGGYAGKKTQENMQEKNTYAVTERRCETVNTTQENIIGYDVEYSLEDRVATVRMDQDPGERIAVINGELQINPATEE